MKFLFNRASDLVVPSNVFQSGSEEIEVRDLEALLDIARRENHDLIVRVRRVRGKEVVGITVYDDGVE